MSKKWHSKSSQTCLAVNSSLWKQPLIKPNKPRFLDVDPWSFSLYPVTPQVSTSPGLTLNSNIRKELLGIDQNTRGGAGLRREGRKHRRRFPHQKPYKIEVFCAKDETRKVQKVGKTNEMNRNESKFAGSIFALTKPPTFQTLSPENPPINIRFMSFSLLNTPSDENFPQPPGPALPLAAPSQGQHVHPPHGPRSRARARVR